MTERICRSYHKFTFLIHASVSEHFYQRKLPGPVDHTYLLNNNSKSNQLCTLMEQKYLLHMGTPHNLNFYTIPVNHKLAGPVRQMCSFISSSVRTMILNTSKSISENVYFGITAIFMAI